MFSDAGRDFFEREGYLVLKGFYDYQADIEPNQRAIHGVSGRVADRQGVAIADFRRGIKTRIAGFKAALAAGTSGATYGAGIYGNFICSCLKSPKKAACFLDQNEFLIGSTVKGVAASSGRG